MIKFKLHTKYKSFEPFSIDLPDFVILTGLNGAGKTQLLTAIRDNKVFLTQSNGLDLFHSSKNLNPLKFVTFQSLVPNESTAVTKEQINLNIKKLWDRFSSWTLKRENSSISYVNDFRDNTPERKIIDKIAASAGGVNIDHEWSKLKASDFYDHYPLHDDIEQSDAFYHNFSSLFRRYQDKNLENAFREFRNVNRGETNVTYLSTEQFIQKYGEPPWNLVNHIIAEAKLDYRINSPADSNPDAPFEIKLINTYSDAEVKFGDLSSGEKVIMSLAIALYNSNFDREFPKLLLMDEPDASLHPSMAKQFIDVIQKVFVIEKGVKVIMTTHSPSTVAFAPEETLYIVNKTGSRLEKATKDKALNILTAGVPSFSVNYENRRQVFVESPNDVLYYDALYQKLSNHLEPEVSLTFISSGDSRTDSNGIKVSNCDQVKSITNTLRKAGNNLIWGIIDWDTRNEESNYVKVLGNGNRYSIENYILDPIFVAALLLHERKIKREVLGLKNNETYTDFKHFDSKKIQSIIDFIVNKVSLTANETGTVKLTTKLANDLQVDIPKWYLHHPGHRLENLILKTFPELNEIKRNKEEALKLEIIRKIIDDIPELISVDLIEVFKNVQAVS